MRSQQSTGIVGLTAISTLLLAACASDGTPSIQSGAVGATRQAAPAQSDTLQACLSRIASSPSPGAKQVAEESCHRAENLRLVLVGTATAKSDDRAAAGTSGDTLEACLARIPKDATVGQRILAEESCERDQANRR